MPKEYYLTIRIRTFYSQSNFEFNSNDRMIFSKISFVRNLYVRLEICIWLITTNILVTGFTNCFVHTATVLQMIVLISSSNGRKENWVIVGSLWSRLCLCMITIQRFITSLFLFSWQPTLFNSLCLLIFLSRE